MNASLLICLAAWVADPGPTTQNTFFSAEYLLDAAVRGQEPGTGLYDEEPPASPQSFAAPQGNPYAFDPFLGQPPVDPAFGGAGGSFGIGGPQPYRMGWSSRYDVGFLPDSGVKNGGASGRFGIFEFNSAWRYTTGWPTGSEQVLFSWTPEFNYRSWSGPTHPDLPARAFRFASDFELATPGNAPASIQLGFTPAFVSDLDASPNGDSFNWDGRGVLFLRATQQLQIALGVAYWKRVDDFLIPYAGVVWTPNDYWEFRLMFPKSRISYFLGNVWGAATWLYGGVEYNVEAYQIDLTGASGQNEKIQIADYRALLGLRGEAGGVTSFVEVGWVFARDVKFLHGTPGFDINTGFVGRLGLRF